MTSIRALFILKKRHNYGHHHNYQAAAGMFNSSLFVSEALEKSGLPIKSAVVLADDNNDINRLVHETFPGTKPTHVFIEGLWVVPSKFDDLPGSLVRLNPGVKWVVRIHSEVPFLANEGVAMGWIPEYLRRGVAVACNSSKAQHELESFLGAAEIKHRNLLPLLSNVYPIDFWNVPESKKDGILDIGCFGAIRPLKNQLQQAFWAVEFAVKNSMPLRFHVNTPRVEGSGENVLRNLKAFFAGLPSKFTLVEHGWESRSDFLKTLSGLDFMMQVSFTETFCISAADSIYVGVPIVVSKEVPWAAAPWADPTGADHTLTVMQDAFEGRTGNVRKNRKSLRHVYAAALHGWLKYFELDVEGMLEHLLDLVNAAMAE